MATTTSKKTLKYKIINNDEQINVESQQFGAVPKLISRTLKPIGGAKGAGLRGNNYCKLLAIRMFDMHYAAFDLLPSPNFRRGWVGTMRANDWAKIRIWTRFRIINVQHTHSMYLFSLTVFDEGRE